MWENFFCLITAIFLFTFTLNVFADTYFAKVIGISDGDTITVLKDRQNIKIRLNGIDCPEKKQDFGMKAKQFTSNFVFGKIVKIEEITIDRYGRTVAMVYVSDKCLNVELIKNGFAWVYTQYCKQPFCSKWNEYQEKAKHKKLGLWDQPDPTPPWEFRHKR